MDEDLEALAEEHSARAYVVRWQVYGASDLHAELAHGSLESLLGTVRERWRGRPAPACLERLTDETVPVLDLDELRRKLGEDGDWVRTIIGRAAKQATAVLTAREE